MEAVRVSRAYFQPICPPKCVARRVLPTDTQRLRFSGFWRASCAASRDCLSTPIPPDFLAFRKLFRFPTRQNSLFRATQNFFVCLPSSAPFGTGLIKSTTAAPAPTYTYLLLPARSCLGDFFTITGAEPLYPRRGLYVKRTINLCPSSVHLKSYISCFIFAVIKSFLIHQELNSSPSKSKIPCFTKSVKTVFINSIIFVP